MKGLNMTRLFIVTAASLAIISFTLYSYGQTSQSICAELDRIEGSVEIKDASGQWKKATPGMVLNLGDCIKTGKRSEASIVITNLDEKVRIRITENTQISLKDIIINSLTGKQDSSVLLNDGSIGVATSGFHMNTAFKAETPNAIVEMGKYGITVRYKEGSRE